MKKLMRAGLAAMAVILLLAGCPTTEEGDKYEAGAELVYLEINLEEVEIPEAVSLELWGSGSSGYAARSPEVKLTATAIADTVVDAQASPKAIIRYATASNDVKPASWSAYAPTSLEGIKYLYIQVTSEDQRTQNYYRVKITEMSDKATLANIRIGGRDVEDFDTTKYSPAEDEDDDDYNWREDIQTKLQTVTFAFGDGNKGALIIPAATDSTAVISYAKESYGMGNTLNFSTTATGWNLDDGDVLYVKVVSSDGVYTYYYGIKVAAPRITSLKLNGVSAPAAAIAVTQASIAGSVAPEFKLEKMHSHNAPIVAEAGTGVTVAWAIGEDIDTPPAANAYVVLTAGAAHSFEDGTGLFLKLSAEGFEDKYIAYNMIVKSTDATLKKLSIGGKDAASFGSGGAAIAVGDGAGLRGAIALSSSQAASGVAVVVEATDPDAKITGIGMQLGTTVPTLAAYGQANITPTGIGSSAVSGTTMIAMENAWHIYVIVQPGDEGEAPVYYRIVATVLSGNATLTALTLSTRAPDEALAYGTDGNWANVPLLHTTIGSADGQTVASMAIAASNANNSMREYALMPNEVDPPADTDFGTQTTRTAVASGSVLYVKSVSADGENRAWYKVLITVKSNVATAQTLIVGTSTATSIGNGGTSVQVTAANRGAITLKGADALLGVTVTMKLTNAGARVTGAGVVASTATASDASYIAVTDSAGPDDARQFALPAAVATTQHLLIRVLAEDGYSLRYYRLAATVQSNDAVLTGINVGTRAVTMTGDPNSGSAWNNAPSLAITLGQSMVDSSVSVTVTRSQTASVSAYALMADGATDPTDDLDTTTTFANVANGNVLYIRNTSQDGTTILWYKVVITVKKDTATAASLSINTIEATLGAGGTTANIIAANRGKITLKTAQAAAGAVMAITLTDADAKVTGYAVAASTNNAPTFVDVAPELTVAGAASITIPDAITDTQHLFIRVVAEDGIATQYYRIVADVLSNNAAIAALTVAGVAVPELGTPAPAADDVGIAAGTANLPPSAIESEAPDISVTATSANNAAISYAYSDTAPDVADPDDWKASGAIAVEDYDAAKFIWIKLVSEDESATLVYKIGTVVKNNVATIASAAFDGGANEGTLPTAAATWAAATAITKTFADPLLTATTIAAVTTDVNATVQYGYSATADEPAWGGSGNFSGLVSGGYIGVKVTAENGITVRYYKWRLSFGSADATLKAYNTEADDGIYSGLYIGGIPANNLGAPSSTGVYSGTGAEAPTNGAISLNSTAAANGRSVVVYTNVKASNVEFYRTGGTSDNITITSWASMTRDAVNPTKWTTTLSAAETTNNRRVLVRVTAENVVDTRIYRFTISYTAATSVLTALTVNGVSVADRGTPGSWNVPDMSAGLLEMYGSADTIEITSIAPTPTTGNWTYAKTSSFPVSEEPTFGAVGTIGSVVNNDYIWLRNISNNFRNTYVLKVGLGDAPFTVTVGGVEIPWGQMGTQRTITPTFNANTTAIGWVALRANQAANAAVTTTLLNSSDTIKVIKATVPNVTGTAIPAGNNFDAATSSLAASSFTGKDYVQVQYTPAGGTPTYRTIYIRRTVDIPYVAPGAIEMSTIVPDAAWATAPELEIDRVFMVDSGSLAQVTDFVQGDPATHARVKVLWSDDGLYYLATIPDATPSVANDHQCDNLEFFISENYTIGQASVNWSGSGGQYRVGRNSNVSGDSTSRVTTVVDTNTTGYTIKTRIAWAAAATTAVNGKLIGIEPQLAYSRSNGVRDAVVMWNNFLSASFQQNGNTGLAYLVGKP
jgi:hypothetical protein